MTFGLMVITNINKPHSSRFRRLDSKIRIFVDNALFGGHLHELCGSEKHVGFGLVPFGREKARL